jgi:hypothetical protein
MPPEDVYKKYRVLAGKVISAENIDALQQMVQEIENLQDVRKLIPLLIAT